MSLKENALILAAIGLGVYLIARNAGSIGQGAAQAAIDAANGIAAPVNEELNKLAPATAEGRSRTWGGWVWDITHPTDAAGIEYGIDFKGNPLPPPGALGGGASGSW